MVNIRSVLTELDNQKKDAAAEFTRLFNDPDTYSGWRFYAMVGMRSLADRGRLNEEQAHTLLEMTATLVREGMSIEEYYKTILSLADAKETAPVLAEFAQQKLEKKEPLQWRWLAFLAVKALLQTRKAAIPPALVKNLHDEAANEPDIWFKSRYQETVVLAEGL